MKKIIYLTAISSIVSILFIACSDNNERAKLHLSQSRICLQKGEFQLAKNELDSIESHYPKAFEERKAALLLLDSIREAENNLIIETLANQAIQTKESVLALKSKFLYERDPKYQDTGIYYPLSLPKSFNQTTLQAGVYENGTAFIKTIYLGSQRHNRIKAYIADETVETSQIPNDGFIHKFKDLGQSYEIIFVQAPYDNGIIKFIADNVDKKIQIELLGDAKYKYTLNEKSKKAILESYKLSTEMLLLDSLNTEIEKAKFKNYYLKNGKKNKLNQDTIQ